tara:strand:+ start:772 stop:891 length:120 start_codon:yes stop_codon:yes gene_type:complete
MPQQELLASISTLLLYGLRDFHVIMKLGFGVLDDFILAY